MIARIVFSFIAIVFLMYRFQSCTGKSVDNNTVAIDSINISKPDTILVLGLYVPPVNNNNNHDMLIMVTIYDTGMVKVNDTLFKKGLVRDSIYAFPRLDTVRINGYHKKIQQENLLCVSS